LLEPYSNEQLRVALEVIQSGRREATAPADEATEGASELELRQSEFQVLRSSRKEEGLVTRTVAPREYGEDVARYFGRVSLVERLRETRVFTGFTRVFAENGIGQEALKAMLWRDTPPRRSAWLPAYVVYGEGIYLELSEDALSWWERQESVMARVAPLARRYTNVRTARRLRERRITPRFVVLHTLAHVLISRLIFECGYSSASLRERLYISDDDPKMAALLIYTAAGDSDGTMGGLVRMGKPGFLEPVLRRALNEARWCAADPVCIEIGDRGGQGPDSCNLAACHNCALVPETACEEFNRFLDRGLLIGTIAEPDIGFFSAGRRV
jgi:hypothetical protein